VAQVVGKKLRHKPQAPAGFVVAASIVLGLISGENWLLRAIAGALLLLGTLAIFVPIIVSRKFECIGPRLVDKSLRVQLLVELLGRLLLLALIIFVGPILFYMCLDFYGLIKRGYPIKMEAVVTYVPGGAIWSWVWKDIGLQTQDGRNDRYNLFFHPAYPIQDNTTKPSFSRNQSASYH
jgi:hypothetical protein